VRVEVADTSWTTSLFPSKEAAAFVLPVKKAVRTAQRLQVGERATFTVTPL
jgi:hypothetical protein